jgi:hypothetical protein
MNKYEEAIDLISRQLQKTDQNVKLLEILKDGIVRLDYFLQRTSSDLQELRDFGNEAEHVINHYTKRIKK